MLCMCSFKIEIQSTIWLIIDFCIPYVLKVNILETEIMIKSSLIFVLLNMLFCFYLDIFVSLIQLPFTMYSYYLTINFFVNIDNEYKMLMLIILNCWCWVLQMFSYIKLEKKIPSNIDNIFQSIILSSFLCYYKVVFLCNIRRELKEKVDEIVLENNRIFEELRDNYYEYRPIYNI